MVGRLNRLKELDADCKFDTQMNVQLADPADAARMQPSKMVRLAGDFKVTRQNNIDYLSVTDARVTWTDPFDRHATAEQPASKVVASNAPLGAAPGDQPAGLISPAGPTQGETTMRKTLMAASSLVLLAGGSQAGAQSNGIPTGIHDPDALTCNAPELVTLAKAVNWRICVQNSLVATLGRDGGLNLGGTAVRSYSDLPISELPTGEGEPNAVTCESAQLLSGTRSRGPIVCAHNAFWAKLAAGGCVLTPDARTIIYSPTSKKWNTFACIHLRGRNGWLPRIFF
jgi:hypothetical protein